LDRKFPITLEIIIPMYNEEIVVVPLFTALEAVFSSEKLERHGISRVRYLIVDDGSGDRTAELVIEKIKEGLPASLYRLSRNFGHQSALAAGLNYSDADVVGVMDADLQDPPEVLLEMLVKWREGYDVVYGVRTKRKDIWTKRICYALFYWLLQFVSEGLIPRDSGDFCVMDRRVVKALTRLPERLRFIRGLRAWVGFRQVGHTFERQKRIGGKPSYTFKKLYELATQGLVASSIRPLRLTQLATLIFFVFSVSSFVLLTVRFKGFFHESEEIVALYALIALSSVMGFMILLCLYILSAYVGRMYLEAKGRPSYLLMEVVGPGEPDQVEIDD